MEKREASNPGPGAQRVINKRQLPKQGSDSHWVVRNSSQNTVKMGTSKHQVIEIDISGSNSKGYKA